MDERTTFIYQNSVGSICFGPAEPFWLSNVAGASAVEVAVAGGKTAGHTGITAVQSHVQAKTLTLDGCLFAPEINRRRLLDVVVPGVEARLIAVCGAEAWYLDVLPGRTPEVAPGQGVQPFQMQLIAPYPYWRTSEDRDVQIAGLTALFRFPFLVGPPFWVSRFSDSYFKTVQNAGNVPIPFTLVFAARAEVNTPELFHMRTRTRIAVNRVLAAGQSVVVSTLPGQKGAKLVHPGGKQENAFRWLAVDSDLGMCLAPGDNLLRLGAAQNRQGLTCRLLAPLGVKSGV